MLCADGATIRASFTDTYWATIDKAFWSAFEPANFSYGKAYNATKWTTKWAANRSAFKTANRTTFRPAIW